MNPNNKPVHPLAKDVRTLRERKQDEASLLKEIEPVRAYLHAHGEELRRLAKGQTRPDKKNPYRLTMGLLIRNTARLGFYDDAKAWSAWLGDPREYADVLPNANPNLDHFICQGRYLRGDYRLGFEGSDASWNENKRLEKQEWVAHLAVMHGDLDEADALLSKIAEYRAGQADALVFWGFQQNCELAVLAHIMGRDDLVLPSLHRARFVFEAGPAMSTRPLEESPDWIQPGDDSHASLYLVHAIAASGFGPTALALLEGRDLVAWGGKYREFFAEHYSFRGFYLCLANGGCLKEGLELARNDPDKVLEDPRFLKAYSATAFRWGKQAMGDELAQRWCDLPRKSLWDVYHFHKEMESLGQTKWAEKATRLILEADLQTKVTVTSFDILRFYTRLPEADQTAAIQHMRAEKESVWEEWEAKLLPLDLSVRARRYEMALAVLGAEPNLEVLRHQECLWVIAQLRQADETDAARELLHTVAGRMAADEFPGYVEEALAECAALGDMELADELIHRLSPSFICLRTLGHRHAAQDQLSWADAFAWALKLPHLEGRIAACTGILAAAADRLTLRPHLRYQSLSKFPNWSVINDAGLHPYILRGIGIGC